MSWACCASSSSNALRSGPINEEFTPLDLNAKARHTPGIPISLYLICWSLEDLVNFSGLLFAFDYCRGVEALAGLLGFPGDDGLIFFDVFVVKNASVNIRMYDMITCSWISWFMRRWQTNTVINEILCSQTSIHMVSIWCSQSWFSWQLHDS